MTILGPNNVISGGKVILSFDIESVHHIEAARESRLSRSLRAELYRRLWAQVEWLRRILDRHNKRATFFWVGEVAWRMPYLVRAVHRDGHEIACHSWAHQPLWQLTSEEFFQDIEVSKRVVEDIIGENILGFRAPTFSLTQKTKWAVTVLKEMGFSYDSSVYPVVHDRYGVRTAPRGPFRVANGDAELLELPPATWCVGPLRLAVGGGGHFRFWPLKVCLAGIRQLLKETGYAMLYFHPWEFDPEQPRLPLSFLKRWRTYMGIGGLRQKLEMLLGQCKCTTARQAAKELDVRRHELPIFELGKASRK